MLKRLFCVACFLMLAQVTTAQAQRLDACKDADAFSEYSTLVWCLQELSVFAENTFRRALVQSHEISELRDELEKARKNALPTGAVVAFDLPDGCPIGWESHSQSSGRTIVGQGVGIGNTRSEPALSERRYRHLGGTEYHRLTIDEMPSHTHGVPFVPEVSNLSGGSYPVMSDLRHNSKARAVAEADSVGAGVPHNNMPPFLVLYYCIKM